MSIAHSYGSALGLLALCIVSCSNDSQSCRCEGSAGLGASCRAPEGTAGAGFGGGGAAVGGVSMLQTTPSTVSSGGTFGTSSNPTLAGASAGGTESLSNGGTSVGGSSATQLGGMGGTSTPMGGALPVAGSGGTAQESTGGTSASNVAGAAPIALTVSTALDNHPISQLIYGVNGSQAVCSNATARFTLCRLGGNPWSTYNWENNASNAGDALCFQNDAALGATDVAGATIMDLLQSASIGGATAGLTIPIIDYVAADKLGGSPAPECSGDVRKLPDPLVRFRQNQPRKGTAYAYPPDASDGYVYQDEFLSYVRGQAGAADVVISLDNQPELWHQTHAPVHPTHATYQEVVGRNVAYAKMVREIWPAAQIAGYGGYGYYAFLNLQDAPFAPGDAEFLDYYLAEMRVAGLIEGERLIDYLDVHWHSEVTVEDIRITTETTSASTVRAEARMQAPRSLWDPSYVEPSWLQMYGAVQLIPWLNGKVDAFYPGTKLAISSWSYGGEQSISGAIAVADALGTFGRYGLGLAAIELPPQGHGYALGAFAAFRNYDGSGASFGDTSVYAHSDDVAKVSVYASVDSRVLERVVIIAINRSVAAQDVTLTLSASAAYTKADCFRITSTTSLPVSDAAVNATGPNRFDTTLPGYSITVLVPGMQ
jgi:hypothetical protein